MMFFLNAGSYYPVNLIGHSRRLRSCSLIIKIKKKILPSVTVRMKFNCLGNLRNLN
jgi:hypothetical protein